jgi:hypothetical protein
MRGGREPATWWSARKFVTTCGRGIRFMRCFGARAVFLGLKKHAVSSLGMFAGVAGRAYRFPVALLMDRNGTEGPNSSRLAHPLPPASIATRIYLFPDAISRSTSARASAPNVK